MMEEELELPDMSYETLNNFFDNPKNKELIYDDYLIKVLPTNKSFIGFLKLDVKKGECEEGKIFKKYGLKFHIGLREDNTQMHDKGWEIVRNTLMKHEVESFKVIRSSHKMSNTLGQEGKDITIYVDAEPSRTLKQWQNLAQELTENLVKNEILPGFRPPNTDEKPEKPIRGSNYISYRYYNERTKKSVWPKEDPCQFIKVTLDCDQPEIPTLEKETKGTEKKDPVENVTKFM